MATETSSIQAIDTAGAVRRFSPDEFLRMASHGILRKQGVELVDGLLMYGEDRWWRFTTADTRLAEIGILGEDDRVELIDGKIIEMSPIGSRHHAVVDRIARTRFGPVEELLLIEVAGSSVKFDRSTKVALYAKYNIPEHWIVDLIQNRVFVLCDPAGDTYQSLQGHQPTACWSAPLLPHLALSGKNIFG